MSRSLHIRFLALFLILCLSFSVFSARPANAAVWGVIQGENGTATKIRDFPVNGNVIGRETYALLEITGSVAGSDGYEWKQVNYKGQTGYVRSDLIAIYSDNDFEQQLKQFPESYHYGLRLLHNLHPNWSFQADNLSMTFAEALAGETKSWETKLVPSSYSSSFKSLADGAYNWSTGKWNEISGSWVSASREVIAYYLDPRNFLTETGAYQFVQQIYAPGSQTEDGLKSICKNTFLDKGFSDKSDYGGSYYSIIMEAARQSKVSPYVIAAIIILEQGVNGSNPLASGEYGYYNFFNYKATGSDVIGSGLAEAKKQGWATRSASIIGGARLYASGYISVGQDTYYYMDFDVQSTPYYTHQYAQSIFDANSKGANLKKGYVASSNEALSLKIPIYKDMPASPAPAVTASDSLNNYYFTALSIEGFSMYKQSYELTVSQNFALSYELPTGASYAGAQSVILKPGLNTVELPVRSQSGYINNYTLKINASVACTMTVGPAGTEPTPPAQAVKLGDTNGDGNINIVDLANVQKHILGIISLSGDSLTAADTNKDGTVNIVDLANIQKHILQIIVLN